MCEPVKRMSFHLTDCIHPHRLVSFRKVINTSRAYTVLNAQIYCFFVSSSILALHIFIFHFLLYAFRHNVMHTYPRSKTTHITKICHLISDIFASELHHRVSYSYVTVIRNMHKSITICRRLRGCFQSLSIYEYDLMSVCAHIHDPNTHTHTHSAPNLFVFHMCLPSGDLSRIYSSKWRCDRGSLPDTVSHDMATCIFVRPANKNECTDATTHQRFSTDLARLMTYG